MDTKSTNFIFSVVSVVLLSSLQQRQSPSRVLQLGARDASVMRDLWDTQDHSSRVRRLLASRPV